MIGANIKILGQRKIKIALYLFFAFFFTVNIFGSQKRISLKNIGLEQGLSQAGAICFTQDKLGFLWIGTQDGLNRYDGYTFKIYRNKTDDPTSLAGNYVNYICEDNNGVIWIATLNNGLSKYIRTSETFKTYRNNPDDITSLSSNDVKVVYQDHLGTLWIGTNRGGLCTYNPETDSFIRFVHDPINPKSISSNNISVIYEDSNNRLWIGTQDNGLCQWDSRNKNFVQYKIETGNTKNIANNEIQAICSGKNEELLIGTTSGLYRYDILKSQFSVFSYIKDLDSLSSSYIQTLLKDSSGTIWIGTSNGLFQYNTNTGEFVVCNGELRDAHLTIATDIRSIYEDRQKLVWIGTVAAGIYCYDHLSNSFALYKKDPLKKNSLINNIVWAFCEDLRGNIWVGTDGGLCRYNSVDDSFVSFVHDPRDKNSLSENIALSLAVDFDGNVWVGTKSSGLCRYSYTSNNFKTYKQDPKKTNSLSSNLIRELYVDSSGTLWVCTRGGGLCRYNHKTDDFLVYRNNPNNPDSISTDEVRTICEGKDKILWVGTYGGGLCRFDRNTGKFTTYKNNPNDKKSISNNTLWALYPDQNGYLWIGTNGSGLNRLDLKNNTFKLFSTADGLPNDLVLGVLEDSQGNIWVSTNKGISRYSPKTNTFRNFDITDGLQSNEFCSGATLKAKNGRMYFGGINGFNAFFPEQVKDNLYVPPVVLTEFKKFNQTAKLNTSITVAKEIVVNYWENFITFEFSALNLLKSQKNKYVFKLEGFDKDWIQSETQRSATYTNLDGGTYVFRVKGSNNDGVWNEEGTAIKVIVIAPPWKRWWAYLAYIAVLSGGVIGGVKFKINRIRERARVKEIRLQAQAAEIKAEAAQAKAEAAVQLAEQNAELDRVVLELRKKNAELIESQQQADRIFSALAEALPGTVLDGKYELMEKIGTGGFGAVFRGMHLSLNKPIAVKIFRPSMGNDSASSIERFKLEGISASRINHPNAVAVLDSGISKEGIAYLVMELLEGHTLANEIKGGQKLTLKRCKEIIVPICEALGTAHTIGIIHRDIKPGNIFLHQGKEGEVVKVVDFGVAKIVEEDTSEELRNLTATGGLLGTPTYMAPERIRNMQYDGKSDVYSVGVVLYEMLCGRTPFLAGSNGVAAIIMGHLMEKVPSMKQFNSEIPEEVEKVIKRALEKNPSKRFTAKEFANAFSEVVDKYI